MPGSRGQGGDLFKHRPTRSRDDVFADFFQIVESELLHHFGKPIATDCVAYCQRVQVANHLIRLAHVSAHDGHDSFRGLAAFKQRQDWNA